MDANLNNTEHGKANPGPGEVPLLVDVNFVARLISMSTRTVWRLVSSGKLLPPIRIGGAARWPLEQIKRWIEQGCPPASSSGKES